METEMALSDVANRLKISWAAAWRLMLTGKLSGRKVDGRWLVTTASVQEYARTRQARESA